MESVKSVTISPTKAPAGLVHNANFPTRNQKREVVHRLLAEVRPRMVPDGQTVLLLYVLVLAIANPMAVVAAQLVPPQEVATTTGVTITPTRIAGSPAVAVVAPIRTAKVGVADPLAAETRVDLGHMGIDLQIG